MEDVVYWPKVSEYYRDYKVLRQIASGAFGSVHCVQRRDTKVILAAKYVKSSDEDLRREVDALLALRKSPLILQFFHFYTSDPPKLCLSVLVTEFLAGGDLIERTSAPVRKLFLPARAKLRGYTSCSQTLGISFF
jgi:serine/threonine protein kinase